MSESESDGIGRREVAYRLFAAEFDDADFSYSESDEDRAPNYVITPTGARVNRLFVVGVLTEIEQVNEEVLRARIVDPTGAFVVYAGQYQPEALAFLEAATPPLFVAITGKARTFEPEDGDRVYTSIRPETISEVDAETRDRWVVQATEQTVDRIARMASAKQTGLAGGELHDALTENGVQDSHAAGIMLALDHYGTTGHYLDALRQMALDATRVVAGELDEVETTSMSPGSGGDDQIPVLADAEFDAEVATTQSTTGEGGVTASDDAASTAEPDAEATVESETDDPSPSETTAEGQTTATASEGVTNEGQSVSTTDSADAISSDVESGAEASSQASTETAATTDTESPSATESIDTESTSASVTESADTTDASSDEEGDELGDFEPEFELDEDEREELEAEYGTEFQSGTDVDEPGQAGIETPDPEDVEAAAEDRGAPAGAADAESAPESPGAPSGTESPEPDADAVTSDAVSETPSTSTDVGADETAGETSVAESAAEDKSGGEETDESATVDAADVDLEDAVMEAMEDLDDGSGADREELLAAVVDQYGADPDAVEDAIQDALMGGRCYEPEDGKLMPI